LHALMLNHNVRGRSTYFRAMGLAKELVKLGHEVTLMTISPSALWKARIKEERGVRVVETPDLLRGNLRTGWDLWDAVRRYRIGLGLREVDLVHAFDNRPAVILPSLAIARKRGIPLCSDWADWWGRGGVISATRPWPLKIMFGGLETFFEEHFRGYAALLTVTSRALERRAIGLGIDSDKIHYLPSGADTDKIRLVSKAKAREALGLAKDVPIVEYMGYVQYDLRLALEAFCLVRRRLPKTIFLLVGPGSGRVHDLVKKLRIEDSVIITGPRAPESMGTWLAAADVLLLPFQDTLYNVGRGPIKLGDYLASGRPLVTNPVGEIRDLLNRETIGLAAGENPEEFAEKILVLLLDPILAKEIGQNARRLAEGALNWREFGGQLEAHYSDLLSR